MAVTIVRTPWIDDDGTGTTGTVINNAVKTALYNDIDGGFAKLAQLAGGNTFTGNQVIAGQLGVTVLGSHTFIASGVGVQSLVVQNAAAGTGNYAQLSLGNDVTSQLLTLFGFASNYSGVGDTVASAGLIRANGAGGFNLSTTTATPVRIYTNNTERLRVTATGIVAINSASPIASGQCMVAHDATVYPIAIVLQNTSATLGYFNQYVNSGGGVAGQIQQTAATSVAYQTTSDARLKDDAGRATDVAALRAVVIHDFAWKADGRTDRGVFAQDAHAVFPRAVSPGTDETTADGHLTHPWMTDYSKFVPDLIVGWQQHDDDLAELRALLVTLKGSADAE